MRYCYYDANGNVVCDGSVVKTVLITRVIETIQTIEVEAEVFKKRGVEMLHQAGNLTAGDGGWSTLDFVVANTYIQARDATGSAIISAFMKQINLMGGDAAGSG